MTPTPSRSGGQRLAVDPLGAAVLHRPRVWRTARAILHDPDAAEDVAQEVFLRLQRRAPTFGHEAQLLAWLHRTTVNLCRDHLRRRTRRAGDVEVSHARGEAELHHEPDPLRGVGRAEARRALDTALDSLAPEQARAVRLRYLEGLEYAEIARRTGTTTGTVASRVFRALKHLGNEVAPTHLEILT